MELLEMREHEGNRSYLVVLDSGQAVLRALLQALL
jgi:hypothetical protein